MYPPPCRIKAFSPNAPAFLSDSEGAHRDRGGVEGSRECILHLAASRRSLQNRLNYAQFGWPLSVIQAYQSTKRKIFLAPQAGAPSAIFAWWGGDSRAAAPVEPLRPGTQRSEARAKNFKMTSAARPPFPLHF